MQANVETDPRRVLLADLIEREGSDYASFEIVRAAPPNDFARTIRFRRVEDVSTDKFVKPLRSAIEEVRTVPFVRHSAPYELIDIQEKDCATESITAPPFRPAITAPPPAITAPPFKPAITAPPPLPAISAPPFKPAITAAKPAITAPTIFPPPPPIKPAIIKPAITAPPSSQSIEFIASSDLVADDTVEIDTFELEETRSPTAATRVVLLLVSLLVAFALGITIPFLV